MYPIVLKLEAVPCLVVGGGAVAARKVDQLLATGAVVTVLAPELGEELQSLAQRGRVRHLPRRYRAGDVASFRLVFAATSSREVNREIYREAAGQGVLVNSVDDPEGCSFYVPSILRRGDLLVAVSTSGKVPALARRLRKYLQEKLAPGLGEELERLHALRTRLRERTGGQEPEKEERIREILDAEIERALRRQEPS